MSLTLYTEIMAQNDGFIHDKCNLTLTNHLTKSHMLSV